MYTRFTNLYRDRRTRAERDDRKRLKFFSFLCVYMRKCRARLLVSTNMINMKKWYFFYPYILYEQKRIEITQKNRIHYNNIELFIWKFIIHIVKCKT